LVPRELEVLTLELTVVDVDVVSPLRVLVDRLEPDEFEVEVDCELVDMDEEESDTEVVEVVDDKTTDEEVVE
jgi:hypothetical protein